MTDDYRQDVVLACRELGYKLVLETVAEEMQSECNTLAESGFRDPQSNWFDTLTYETSKLWEIVRRLTL